MYENWDNFLEEIADVHGLDQEEREAFRAILAEKGKIKSIRQLSAKLNICESAVKTRMGKVYETFAQICPRIDGDSKGKAKALQVWLNQQYCAQPKIKATEAIFSLAIAPPDWHKICHEMLESQKQSIRRQATEIVSEPFYVQLGLVDRKQQSRRSSDFSLPPEQGSSFFQLSEEEIIETYEHNEFLEQVIKQGQTKKSQGKRIAIIGEPGAGKTTLLEAIALSPKTPGFPIWISLGSLGEAASALGKTQQYKQEAINVLCEIINETIQTGKDQQLLQQALESLKQLDSSILYSLLSWQQEIFLNRGINVTLENENGWACILALTKHYLEEENCLEETYYKHIWRCAQVLNYPDFYQAWHSRVYGTRTEKGEDITVIEFTKLQPLANQLIDIPSQVQRTEKTYPITIDTQTLKLETNISAIAQKFCTKIHRKAGYSNIPIANDAAQLQQYIPRIQDKLQKPNLALILHGCEPNEHLVNFCYSLGDRDLGIYISLITSQPLEQPLKGFLPDQPNLLSAIQSWIDELG